MAAKKDEGEPRRLNRAVKPGQALGGVLDPVFKKRGFASRDLVTHWAAMAPAPYDRVARPDKLTWPRGRSAEGATLYLSCHAGHTLALAHEGDRITQAVNRYFGYLLLAEVRISATPFVELQPAALPSPAPLGEVARARVARLVERVQSPQMREALRQLGHAMARKR